MTWGACRSIDFSLATLGLSPSSTAHSRVTLGNLLFSRSFCGLLWKREIWLLYVPLKGFNVMLCLQYIAHLRYSDNSVVRQALNSVLLLLPASTPKIPAPMAVFRDFQDVYSPVSSAPRLVHLPSCF